MSELPRASQATPRGLAALAALAATLGPTGFAHAQEPVPLEPSPADPALAPPPPPPPPPPAAGSTPPAQPAPAQPAPLPPGSAVPGAPAPPPSGYPAPAGVPPGAAPPGYYPPPGYGPYPPQAEPPTPENPWPKGPEPAFLRHKLSVQTEAVFSADEGPFYNHLFGARYDLRASAAMAFGAYAAYANLKGTGKRVHSSLFMGQFEYRFFFGAEQRFIVPLRAGLGYLVDNGVVVRFATGLFYKLEEWEVGLDLITPTFWSAHNDTVISMNLALEVGMAF